MKKAIVTLWGKYKYPVEFEESFSFHDMALAISLAIHRAENKTKFTGYPRCFNYVYECLLRKSCLNFRLNSDSTVNNDQEMLNAANELNSKSEWIQVRDHYEKQEYRLGYTQNKVLIIDIDGKDMDNLFNVRQYYEGVLNCKFTTIATKNGYWLFSDKKYNDFDSWAFDHCRVLNPQLKRADFHAYKEQLLKLDENKQGDFKRATPEIIKASGLYHAPKVLSFDIAFTFLSIKRERSTIRYTKKSKDDKIEILKL